MKLEQIIKHHVKITSQRMKIIFKYPVIQQKRNTKSIIRFRNTLNLILNSSDSKPNYAHIYAGKVQFKMISNLLTQIPTSNFKLFQIQ